MKKTVTLKRREERRLLTGHLWIFSNEIGSTEGQPTAGDVVEILRHDAKFLGLGFYHPHSLIAVRMLSADRRPIDAEFFRERVSRAIGLRNICLPGETALRLVHGESDLLPGLIVDRYGPALTVQTFSAGMDLHLPVICDVLEGMLAPSCIIARNDSPTRALEHLPQVVSVLRGTPAPVSVSEHSIRYAVDLLKGQKTGLFLDQKANRLAVRTFATGRKVLDCFCNDGGFSLNAAKAGASSVQGVDISPEAVERASQNAQTNGLGAARFFSFDVFDNLRERLGRDERFDCIILDPPSFTKSRKTVATALHGYRTVNTLAFKLLKSDGILVTASCSHHIDRDAFISVVSESAVRAGRRIQILEQRGASPDHPVLPSMPETEYLKFAIVSVM